MSWYIAAQNKQIGPVSASDVMEYLSSGTIFRTTKIYGPGMSKWEDLALHEGRIKALASSTDNRVSFASAPAKEVTPAPKSIQPASSGSATLCNILGVICLLIGMVNLLDPSLGSDALRLSGSGVANVHKLTMGETFSIMGAIFLAAGIRPR